MNDIRVLALSRLMSGAMQNDDEIYLPSAFWTYLNEIHENAIIERGIQDFKLHANFHYFQHLVENFNSVGLRHQISLWPTHFDDTILEAVFENEEVLTQLGRGSNPEVYRIFVSLLWGLTKHHDTLGLFAKLSEPLVGNPPRIRRGDSYISQDLCNSYREFQSIVTHSYPDKSPNDRVIGELGSGYGRVGYVFGMLSNARYCFFDIPPALAIAQTYFETVFPETTIFQFRDFKDFADVEEQIRLSRFAFFTANQIAKFPDGYFDTFINISSLHEMTLKQIQHYLSRFDQLTRVSIYLKQWQVSTNDFDHVTIRAEDYELPDHWEAVMDQPDLVAPNFFERLLLRR